MNNTNTEQTIQEIAERIAKQFHPEKIILFGSWAWGNPGPDSDIDLLVVKDTDDPHALAREIGSILTPRSLPLDLLVQTPVKLNQKIREERNLFLEDIVNNGRVLYAHNQIRD